jgi:hypothetical protein
MEYLQENSNFKCLKYYLKYSWTYHRLQNACHIVLWSTCEEALIKKINYSGMKNKFDVGIMKVWWVY